MTRRLLFALAALASLIPPTATAQNWPSKQPIRIIIPFTAGSATDIVARTVMEQVEIMAGRVDFYFVPLPPTRGLLQGGKIAVLAVSSGTRASALPDVPTTIEAGFPNSDYNFWVGLWAPSATPTAIVERMNAETVKALQQPGVKEKIANAGGDPLPMTPAAFDAFSNKEIDVNAMLVKAAGVQVN
jgi:tripartite-type tricarboxylate transporter receptor subunit TctC